MPPCQQCGKPAIVAMPGQEEGRELPLCLEHYEQFQRVNARTLRALEDHHDRLLDDIDDTWALPRSGGRYRDQRNPETIMNFKIDNSAIGVLNTGTIQHLNGAVSAIHGADARLAEAFTRITEAVSADMTLPADLKRDAVDLIDAVATEAQRAEPERRPAVAGPLLTRLSEMITVGGAAATAWHAYGPVILHALGLG